jgi:hypothetical protein
MFAFTERNITIPTILICYNNHANVWTLFTKHHQQFFSFRYRNGRLKGLEAYVILFYYIYFSLYLYGQYCHVESKNKYP